MKYLLFLILLINTSFLVENKNYYKAGSCVLLKDGSEVITISIVEAKNRQDAMWKMKKYTIANKMPKGSKLLNYNAFLILESEVIR